MTKNTAKIRRGLETLSYRHSDIVGGTVVAGSLDTNANTVSVIPDNTEESLTGVLLAAVTNEASGVVLVPEDDSKVIICCIDGPGLWTVIKMSELKNVAVKIGDAEFTIDQTTVRVNSGSTLFDVGNVFKMNTGTESLFALLNDLITAITTLTVGTPSGPSTVPVNAAAFSAIQTRLSNLLSA